MNSFPVKILEAKTAKEIRAAAEYLDAVAKQLFADQELLLLAREQFQKFIKPAMHAVGKMLPEMALLVQQNQRVFAAQELKYLVEVRWWITRKQEGTSHKLDSRIEHLIAQCSKP